MNISDLIGIGRLGGRDDRGFFHVLVKPEFRTAFNKTDDVFLIFNSDRVFYVTISERKVFDRKLWIRFAEDGIAEERARHKEAIIAIEPFEEQDEGPDVLIGYTVIHEGVPVGTLMDYFYNNAQYVLVIQSPDGKEILVPFVEHFIAQTIDAARVIELRNASGLIDPEAQD
jgi:16S rRNA processing protein RimM